MDKRFLFALPGLLVLIVVGIALWFVLHTKAEPQKPAAFVVSSTPSDLSGQAIYTNGEYGFSIFYPESAKLDKTFAQYYHLAPTWREGAPSDATGTPIISIVAYRIENEHSYPRYFDAEVRIGESKDPQEVRDCEKATNGEAAVPDVNLGGTTFKAFSFEDAGMMQYAKGVSYRALHDGACFAIEKIETGSSYRDDPASENDIPDSTLDAKYASLDQIVETFSFADS